MNKIASELLFMAKEVMGIDFPTQKALDKYLKDHPDADKSNHRVVEGPEKHSGRMDNHRQKEIRRVMKTKPGEKLTDDDIRKFHDEGGPNRKDVDWFGLGKGKTP
jgi:hypothetical protein